MVILTYYTFTHYPLIKKAKLEDQRILRELKN